MLTTVYLSGPGVRGNGPSAKWSPGRGWVTEGSAEWPPILAAVERSWPVRILPGSHTDHWQDDHQFAAALAAFTDIPADRVTVRTVDVSFDVQCALVGPVCGDPAVTEAEVRYVTRSGRAGATRALAKTPMGENHVGILRVKWPASRRVTAVFGPAQGDDPRPVLYTMYGGPAAPREPWDPTLDDAGRRESEAFWAEHALVVP